MNYPRIGDRLHVQFGRIRAIQPGVNFPTRGITQEVIDGLRTENKSAKPARHA
jgi:hypothetical protein